MIGHIRARTGSYTERQKLFFLCLTFFVFESGTTGSTFRTNQAASFPTPSAELRVGLSAERNG